MNMEEIPIKIWNKSSKEKHSGVITLTVDQECSVKVAEPRGGEWNGEGKDLFKALSAVREKMEPHDLYILCNGSRKDVTPSGMSRAMGKGRKAYRISLGKQAFKEDLLDIFDPVEPEQTATIQQQKDFYQQWIKSLGSVHNLSHFCLGCSEFC